MGPWVMVVGGIMLVAAVLMHERDAPWEWSFTWGFAEGSTRMGKAVGILGVILLLLGGELYLYGGAHLSVLSGPSASAARNCALNQVKITAAKDQLSLANRLTNGTALTPAHVEQLGAFIGGWPAIRCKSGGAYEVGKIGEPVRCSVHGQKMP